MTLKTDLKQFIDDEGNVLDLTKQAKTVFKFVSKIVSSVSDNIEQPWVEVGLKCASRGDGLSCEGNIEAMFITTGIIEWNCNTCEAAGTIINWQGSLWDKQTRTIH